MTRARRRAGARSPRFVDDGPRRERALPIPERDWKKYRRLLCHLYRNNTLKVVREIMAARHNFRPSKRQLAYKFELWGVQKYKRPRAKPDSGSVSDYNTPDVFSDDEHLLDPSPGPSAETEEEVFSLIQGDKDDMFVECGSCHSCGGYDEGRHGDSESELEEEVPLVSRPDLDSVQSDDYRRKLAADFFAALSDDYMAFHLYSSLCETAPFHLDVAARESLVVSCVRSASQPATALVARGIMARYRAEQRDAEKPFLFSMLDAYMQERGSAAGHAAVVSRIADIMSGVLGGGHSVPNLPHPFTAIDLVTYQLLFHGLDVYAEALRTAADIAAPSSEPTFIRDGLLDQYVMKQPFVERLRRDQHEGTVDSEAPSALRCCVLWCRQQLRRADLAIPFPVRDISGDRSHRHWTENIQLFCALWDSMLGCVQHEAVVPAWYANSRRELRISPSELLVTVCWMLGDEQESGTTAEGQLAQRDPPQPVLERAGLNAAKVLRSSEGDLWSAFLDKFVWMNKLVDPCPADKDFEARAVSCVRAYVTRALDIQLPLLLPSQQQQQHDELQLEQPQNQPEPEPASRPWPQPDDAQLVLNAPDSPARATPDFLDLDFLKMNFLGEDVRDVGDVLDPRLLGGTMRSAFGLDMDGISCVHPA